METTAASWISHVEAFVDSSRPSNDQVASINAIAALIKKDLLTFEALVREMEMYLTTSDHVIRSRGILLLAEVLTHLLEKLFDSRSISSFTGFFTAKLEDWHALHGVLVGCLALLRRTKKFGMVESKDAHPLFESFLRNVDVQSLAVIDRKLSFDVLQCLLNNYPEIAAVLAEDLVYGTCAAIDEEKDPRCLILTFHLVKSLAQLFPDPSGPVGSYSSDIFDILSRYFPIYFTHPKSDSLGINRDDISRALMHAFSSGPYFEPYVIPLLLEKLSSSLPLAKLDSLVYLQNCIHCYGADRMRKHARAIWFSLKDLLFNLPQNSFLLTSETVGEAQLETNQIAKEAINCFEAAILYLNSEEDSLLRLVIDDEDIRVMFEAVLSDRDQERDDKEVQHKLSVLTRILSTTSKVSTYCCTKVFQKFFPFLMKVLGVSARDSSCRAADNSVAVSDVLHVGALSLCIEFLTSCRELSLVSQEFSLENFSEENGCFYMLRSLSGLYSTFISLLQAAGTSILPNNKNGQQFVSYAVKGLQLLATFPRFCSPISESAYEDLLIELMSIVTSSHHDAFLWKTSLDALVHIGSFIESANDSNLEKIYRKNIVEPVISLLQLDDSIMPIDMRLDAISRVGGTGTSLLVVNKALEEFVFSNLDSCIKGNMESTKVLPPALKCYSSQVLPRCCTYCDCEDAAVQFAVRVWNQIMKMPATNECIIDQGVLEKVIMAMKLVVASCSEDNQSLIIQKVNTVLVSLNAFGACNSSTSSFWKPGGFHVPNLDGLSCRDEWVISQLVSVVIALRPQTPLVDVNTLIDLLISFFLKGFVPAAQALASMINKWPSNIQGLEGSPVYSLDQVIELILARSFQDIESGSAIRKCNLHNEDNCLHENVLSGLAWVAKGLLMRGHEKVKEIAMLLLKLLLINKNIETSAGQCGSGNTSLLDESTLLLLSAADAFHIIMSDSEDCLNRKFHATVKPLYKQRFFSSMLPILNSEIKQSDSLITKNVLSRAFGNIICNTPLVAVITEAKKIIPPLLDTLAMLSSEINNQDMIYGLLLVLSGILMDDDGKEVILENISTVASHLLKLISYPHMMLVRETAIQCLIALSSFPHARIYPVRQQVLRAISTALDDRKRVVRQEAVRCRQAWASIASRSLQF